MIINNHYSQISFLSLHRSTLTPSNKTEEFYGINSEIAEKKCLCHQTDIKTNEKFEFQKQHKIQRRKVSCQNYMTPQVIIDRENFNPKFVIQLQTNFLEKVSKNPVAVSIKDDMIQQGVEYMFNSQVKERRC